MTSQEHNETRQVEFTALPIQVACPIPVTPDGRTLDTNDEALPLEDRTVRCAVWAHWMIGGTIACDVHAELFCRLAHVDFDDLCREAGRNPADARRPWHERERSTQDDAQLTVRMLNDAHENIAAAHVDVYIAGMGEI